MSGIVGVWNLDGAPLDEAIIGRMSLTLAHRGPDGNRRHVAGSIGFAHQHLLVTPEEAGERQPLTGRHGVTVTLDGRLDNRDELIGALALSPGVSDAACILAAYDAWDEGFPEHLNGDFALSVYDPRRRLLVLARDALGVRPLYYLRTNRLFAFASEIKALLAHPDVVARPDDDGLADFLMLGSRPLDRQDVTCFAGISALVPSHMAVVTPERLTVRQYWDFDGGRQLILGSFDEYAEAFHERFAEAVGRRARAAGPVAVSVSGGLDSSSIIAQAETLRRAGAISAPAITGISYVAAEGSEADEQRYLGEIERQYGLSISRIPIEPLRGVVSGAREQIRSIEAPFLDYVWGATKAVRVAARAAGAKTLLTGIWGDQVLFSSAYLVDLALRFRWGMIAAHTREYARFFGVEGARELKRRFALDLVRRLTPGALFSPLKALRRKFFRPPRVGPWFSDAFLERGLRFANRRATIGHGFATAHARSIYIQARSKYHVHCMEWNNKTSALHGLDASFPFLDRDLVGFLMAVPGDVQARGGVPRVLLREGLRGVLPDAIRARTWKADFTDSVNTGVAQDMTDITATLSPDCQGVRWGYFDPVRLAREVGRMSASLTGAHAMAAWELTDMFGLEVWLNVFLREPSAGGMANEQGKEGSQGDKEAVSEAAPGGAR
jgi:asparagine synthase (glutamine-hydrolysing)